MLSSKKLGALLKQPKIIACLWFALAIVGVLLEVSRHSINNYLIYKGVFTHTIEQVNLYIAYPELYKDTNHYGPLFSMIIGPFALLPNNIGVVLWAFANALVLYKAINMLPVTTTQKSVILCISAIEMMTSIHNLQVNCLITALIIFTYVMVKNKQDIWATLFIALGFYIKLYGIVALVFFLFSEQKLKFILSFIFWMAVLFVLPMAISSPHFIVQSYYDWYTALVEKNSENVCMTNGCGMQDISIMGIVKRIFNLPGLSTLWFLIPGAIIYGLSLLRFKQYKALNFQLGILASTLLFIVLFSTSSESPTYIIAVTGVALWFIIQPMPKTALVKGMLIFVLVLTSICTTDACPRYIRHHFIKQFALKALPCFVVWGYLASQLLTEDYNKQTKKTQSL